MSVVRSLVAVSMLMTASIALQWAPTPKDGDIIYACVGNDVTFLWSYTVSPGEEVTSMEWLFDGSSQEMMAILSHGVFVPLPAFSGRLQQTANGGIVLSHVTAGDVGNYTLEINLRMSPDAIKHTLILQVTSGLPTSDGHLHVHQQQDAVLDSASQRWSLVLSCGHFTFLGQPAFPVEWLTPSGHVKSSSAYEDGYFDLHLASPVDGGTYTCRVPPQHAVTACLHGNHSAAGQASMVVDKMEARMTLMEAEVRALVHDKQQLQQQLTDLTHNMTQQVASFDDRLRHEMDNRLTLLQTNLTSADVQLRQELSVLETTQHTDNATLTRMIHDAKTPLIGFNAQSRTDQRLRAHPWVQFDDVRYNAGQGYDSATGVFSAPLTGAYFFTFHTQPVENSSTYSFIYAKDREVCSNFIDSGHRSGQGSCNAVVHLTKGDQVWVQPNNVWSFFSDGSYSAHTTSFAGFLFYADS